MACGSAFGVFPPQCRFKITATNEVPYLGTVLLQYSSEDLREAVENWESHLKIFLDLSTGPVLSIVNSVPELLKSFWASQVLPSTSKNNYKKLNIYSFVTS